MKPYTHRLTGELVILFSLIVLKGVDLQTGCVETALGACKQVGRTVLPGDSFHAGLWDGYGGLYHAGQQHRTYGPGSVMPKDAAIRTDCGRTGPCLNLGSAHYELAKSGFWTWTRRGRDRE